MTAIQWTDVTDNIFVVRGDDGKQDGWYCFKVSPGCKNCYAEGLNQSTYFKGNKMKYTIPSGKEFPTMMMKDEVVDNWARQRKPQKHFVNSMTDTFGEFIPDQWIYTMFDGMIAAPLQTFQVLTKRAERMCDTVNKYCSDRGIDALPSNIWLGVSAENQEWFDKRVPFLVEANASVRFLSLEPLLGPVDIKGITPSHLSKLSPDLFVQWVIIGGESGSDARPMDESWVDAILEQCYAFGISAFVKQMGSVWAKEHKTKHKKGGDINEWCSELRVREFPL